jgi:hypothetical protein
MHPRPSAACCIAQIAARSASPWADRSPRLPSVEHHRSPQPPHSQRGSKGLSGANTLVPGPLCTMR